MRAFVVAKERFAVHLRPEDVAQALHDAAHPADLEDVVSALDALARPEWGNLLAFPDTSRVSTLEDFRRRRMIYQLSGPGEAGERALEVFDQALGERGELQAVALENISVQLAALALALSQDPLDGPVVHNGLTTLTGIFRDLADNAAAFMGSVQRSIDLYDVDVDAFIAYKDQLVRYIERFLQDLVVRGPQIAAQLDSFDATAVDRMCQLVAGRELADRPPSSGGNETLERDLLARRWHQRWRGLVDWFQSVPHRPSEALLLRNKARAAVPALLAVVAALAERQSGRSDRSTDFLALAELFAALPSAAARHRLWRCAFGLTAPRHLSITAESLDNADFRETPPTTPWATAPPVAISARLRATGTYERRGVGGRIKDRAAARQFLEDSADHQSEQAAHALESLAARTPARLSELGELPADAFELLLSLVGDAIAALGDGPQAEIASPDGGVMVRIEAAREGQRAVIATPAGTLRGPDHLIDVLRVGVAA
jgi:uncharacterized protein (TIGR02677 family)